MSLDLDKAGARALSVISGQNGIDVTVVSSDYDPTTGTFVDNVPELTTIASATTTTVSATPATTGHIKKIFYANFKNTYAGSHQFTVQITSGSGGPFVQKKITLAQDETLEYTHGSGWKALDASGAEKYGTSGWVITAGKTGTLNNSLIFTGTDGKTYTFPTTDATIARTDAANTFSGVQTFSAAITASTATNPFTTNTTSWIGPSGTVGIYFQGNSVGFGTSVPRSLTVGATAHIVDIDGGTSFGTLTFHGFSGTNPVAEFSIAASSNGCFIDSTGHATAADNIVSFRTSNTNSNNSTLLWTMDLLSNGAVDFPNIGTTASGANAFLDNANSNNLLRSTSSLKYKTSVELASQTAVDSILLLDPIWYRSLCDADRKDWSFYGFGAEDVAKVDPRLVHFTREVIGYEDEPYEVEESVTEAAQEEQITVIDGKAVLHTVTVQRPVADAFPVVDESGAPVMRDGGPVWHCVPRMHQVTKTRKKPVLGELIPDGVQYDRVVVLLLGKVKQLAADFEAYKAAHP